MGEKQESRCRFPAGSIVIELEDGGEMLRTSQIATHASGPYVLPADFCRLFEKEMDRLYTLAYLLTLDDSAAEVCFVQGLEDATSSNRVFKEWADSWARRMIVQNAIQIVQPRQGDSGSPGGKSSGAMTSPVIEAISGLPAFERFVFVMSVLEHYSDQDCSLLLDCSRGDVIAARTRALQQMASAAQLHDQPTTESRERALAKADNRRKAAPRLAFA
jgi:DNA-directed RNA polymerase specialized sigma24 family protein